MNVNQISTFRLQHYLLKLVAEKGISKSLVKELPMELADRPVVKGENYYYYDGPLDEKTRPFCKQMLAYDKVVSETDIDILSNYLDYDVKQYKGSYNCRHRWVKFRGSRISTPDLTVGQIKTLISKGIKG